MVPHDQGTIVIEKKESDLTKTFEEIYSAWGKLVDLKEVQSLEELNSRIALYQDFLAKVINKTIFDQKTWDKVLQQGAESASEGQALRMQLSQPLSQADGLLRELAVMAQQSAEIVEPGTPAFQADGGKTYSSLRKEGVNFENVLNAGAKVLWEKSGEAINESIQTFVDRFDQSLDELNEIISRPDPGPLTSGSVSLVFHGDDWKNGERQLIYEQLERARKRLDKNGFDYLWKGPIDIYSPEPGGDRGVVYLSPPEDRIEIHDKPSPYLTKAVLHEMGNRFFYKKLDPKDQRRFLPEDSQRLGRVDSFANQFVRFLYGQLRGEQKKQVEDLLERVKEENLRRKMQKTQVKEEAFDKTASVVLSEENEDRYVVSLEKKTPPDFPQGDHFTYESGFLRIIRLPGGVLLTSLGGKEGTSRQALVKYRGSTSYFDKWLGSLGRSTFVQAIDSLKTLIGLMKQLGYVPPKVELYEVSSSEIFPSRKAPVNLEGRDFTASVSPTGIVLQGNQSHRVLVSEGGDQGSLNQIYRWACRTSPRDPVSMKAFSRVLIAKGIRFHPYEE